jgi:hypothetical protein
MRPPNALIIRPLQTADGGDQALAGVAGGGQKAKFSTEKCTAAGHRGGLSLCLRLDYI